MTIRQEGVQRVGGYVDADPTDLEAFHQQVVSEVDARIADARADRHLRGGPANAAMRMPHTTNPRAASAHGHAGRTTGYTREASNGVARGAAPHGNRPRVFVKPSSLRSREPDVRVGSSANPVMATKLPHTRCAFVGTSSTPTHSQPWLRQVTAAAIG
jgi:hypothetical protein